VAATHETANRSGRTILLVDDDPGMIEILEVNLARASFRVLSAQNGAEALSLASVERPDLILLDVSLPDLDGLDVCRRLKESPPTRHIPVILISTDVDSGAVTAGMAAGAEDCISKPFGPSEVVTLAQACVMRAARHCDVNALTRLPGHSQIRKRVADLVRENRLFAILYLDINSLEASRDAYGPAWPDRAVRLLAEVVRDALRLIGDQGDLIGHGSDDGLVVVTTPDRAETLCRKVIADFESRVVDLHDSVNLDGTDAEREGSIRRIEGPPNVTLSISVVTNRKRRIRSVLHADKIAAELREYLRRVPASDYCFDQRRGRVVAGRGPEAMGAPESYRQDIRSLRRAMSWIDLFGSALEAPIASIEGDLRSLLRDPAEDLDSQFLDHLKSMETAVAQLLTVREELEVLKGAESDSVEASLDHVELMDAVERATVLVRALAGQKNVEIVIQEGETGPRIMVDERSLTQGLFHVLRGLVDLSESGDQVRVGVVGDKGPFVVVEVGSFNCVIPPRELAGLFRAKRRNGIGASGRNSLHLAMAFVRSLGGELKVKSDQGLGTVFTVLVPKQWRSCVDQISRMQAMVELSSQEARSQFDSLRGLLSSPDGQPSPQAKESLGALESRVRELEVLCNLSLLMADDLSSDLEKQSGRVLDQEADGLLALEAILAMAREMAGSLQGGYVFDSDSTRRVARYALAVAEELRLDGHERRALYHAALLRDLDVVISLQKVLAQRKRVDRDAVPESTGLSALIEQRLSRIRFLQPALSAVSHRYERFDGSGNPDGQKGAEIPLGARILAAAEAFETMISRSSPAGTLDPEEALRELAADSGGRFDPLVVGALLRAWRAGTVRSDSEDNDL
jgi:response regulator RpfG family c-di-GMP phosphodiesterase/signal transduction histidine kinase